MMRSPIFAFGFALCTGLVLTGCTSSSTEFMGDTSKFAVDAKYDGALVYRHPSKATKDYSKVWLDTMEVRFVNPADASEIDPNARQEFIDFWRSEVEKHLVTDRNFTLAKSAGQGTLRLRLALTGVRPAKQGQLFTATAMPGRMDIGSATMEAEAIDSQTGERIFALIDQSATHRPVAANQLEYAKNMIKEWTDRLFKAH